MIKFPSFTALTLVAAVSLMSVVSQADDSPVIPSDTLAQLVVFGGLAAPAVVAPKAIRIKSDGAVTYYDDFTKQDTPVAQLSDSSLARVKAMVAGAAGLDFTLKDQSAGEPMCTDTPTVSYEAWIGGKAQAFEQTMSCHMFTPNNANLWPLTQILDGLRALAH